MASRSVNKVILVGHIGKDAETRFTPSGASVANFTLATNRRWKDQQTGDWKEETDWHKITLWRAENLAPYLMKGKQVYVEGRLQTRKYEKDGQDHYSTEIIADTMKMLGSRSGMGGGEPRETRETAAAGESRPAKKPAGQFQDMDDDIPF